MSQYVTLEFKRGIASQWTSVNPTLAPGEPGFELDTGKEKIGDGITPWNNLAYVSALSTVDGSIKLGQNAGLTNQGQRSVALGVEAGKDLQGYSSANDGNLFGVTGNSIAIGYKAGQADQRNGSIAIGTNAGANSQKHSSIAIGGGAGYANQGSNSIAIGTDAAYQNQGSNSIAIGKNAGMGPTNPQASNTIILNASGLEVDGVSGQTGSFYVRPIRQDLTKTVPLMYDPATYEIVQGASGIDMSSGITFCGNNFSNAPGGLFAPPYNVDIQIPGLTTTSNVQVTAKLTSGIDYPTCSILYAETTTDTLTVYVSSNPSTSDYGLMWKVVKF